MSYYTKLKADEATADDRGECGNCDALSVVTVVHRCGGWTDFRCEICLDDWTEPDITCKECE